MVERGGDSAVGWWGVEVGVVRRVFRVGGAARFMFCGSEKPQNTSSLCYVAHMVGTRTKRKGLCCRGTKDFKHAGTRAGDIVRGGVVAVDGGAGLREGLTAHFVCCMAQMCGVPHFGTPSAEEKKHFRGCHIFGDGNKRKGRHCGDANDFTDDVARAGYAVRAGAGAVDGRPGLHCDLKAQVAGWTGELGCTEALWLRLLPGWLWFCVPLCFWTPHTRTSICPRPTALGPQMMQGPIAM